MGYETCNDRLYFFGPNENTLMMITVANGNYLSADRIRHYEDIYGPLYSVRYHGKTVICI